LLAQGLLENNGIDLTAGCGKFGWLSSAINFIIVRLSATVARWPNFLPNNSKEAPKNCPWPGKIGGRKKAEFGKKWQKRGRKLFLQ
jgi:hypothetical protein